MPPLIAVFPKCYFDEIFDGRRDYVQWVHDARALGAEGLEHYDGFFRSYAEDDVAPVVRAVEATGQTSAMLCFSPDFTHPDRDERARQVARQRDAIDLAVRLGAKYCRTLSGQRYPGLSRRDGIDRTVEGILRSLEHAERRGVTLCLENHYKDGRWLYPEFAQPEDIFLEIVERIDSPSFGVQYDPSNATVGGYDPIAFLDKVKARVVTMHASDRYLAPGATLADLRSADGSTGYAAILRHGEVGKGLNDYDAIFRILSGAGFSGWISVEDGMNGLEELARSVTYLVRKRGEHWRNGSADSGLRSRE